MFKTPFYFYSSSTCAFHQKTKYSSFTFFISFLWHLKTWGFRLYELDSHKNSSAPVLLLGLASFFLQSLKLCLCFLLCNKTGRRWRAVSNHYLSCLVQNACSCPPFSLLKTPGCVHTSSACRSSFRINFPFHFLSKSKQCIEALVNMNHQLFILN